MTYLLFAFLFLQPSKHEPIDVPTITEEYGPYGATVCDMGCVFIVKSDKPGKDPLFGPYHRQTHNTCADKRRFLMTAEDGSTHCILLKNSDDLETR